MDAETEARRVQGARPRCQSRHEQQSWDRNAGSLAPTQSELRLSKSRSGHQDWPWAGGVPRFALCCGSGSWRLVSTTCPTDRLLGGCGRGCPSISTQAVRGQPAGLPSRTCEPCPEGRAHRAAWPLRWQRGPSALSCQVSGQGDARHGRVHGLAEPRGPHGAAVISSDRRAEAASGWSGFCFRSVLVWLEAKVVALTVAPQGSVPIRQSLIDAGPRAGRHAGAENRGGPGWGPGGRGDRCGRGRDREGAGRCEGRGEGGGLTGGHDAPDGAPASLPRPGLCRPWRPLPPCQPELPEGGAWAVFASVRPQLR